MLTPADASFFLLSQLHLCKIRTSDFLIPKQLKQKENNVHNKKKNSIEKKNKIFSIHF